MAKKNTINAEEINPAPFRKVITLRKGLLKFAPSSLRQNRRVFGERCGINFDKRFPKFDFGNAKRFGQNFLKNKNIAGKITEAASVNENDVVLEVGPGKGRLTEILAQKAKYVIAVEKDKKLADFLTDKFSAKGGKGQKNLKIVHKDILNFDPKAYKLKPKSYKIVANIPYYITSRFLRQFLESKNQPSLMALMVQKEVALRIVAKNNKESLLSIGVKAYGKPRIVANVSAGNFFPKPKVNSAIILIGDISKDFFFSPGKNKINEKKFFRLLKIGFGHKRKLLKNNLQADFAETNFLKCFRECGIPALARPEELSLKNWGCLYHSCF